MRTFTHVFVSSHIIPEGTFSDFLQDENFSDAASDCAQSCGRPVSMRAASSSSRIDNDYDPYVSLTLPMPLHVTIADLSGQPASQVIVISSILISPLSGGAGM